MSLASDRKIALRLTTLVFIMLVLAFLSVPFYRLFCQVTGFSGTTQLVDHESSIVLNQEMVIRFSATTMADMPWEFRPVNPKMRIKIGETNIAYFEAYNPTDDVITGSASYNVAPLELGGYFNKIDCFCFTEQTLQPGERVTMPVTFYVDPAMADDPDVKDMRSVILAYTFHLTKREHKSDTTTNKHSGTEPTEG